MPSAKDVEGESGSGDGEENIPDWTTWLRSRLERVSNSERTAAGSTEAPAREADGHDQPEPRRPAGPADEQAVSDEGVGSAERLPVEVTPSEQASPVPDDHSEDDGPEVPLATSATTSARMAPPPTTSERPIAPVPDSAFLIEMEALRAAVTALVAGVGVLTDTFTGFRSVVSERLTEYNGLEIGERLQRLGHGIEGLGKLRGEFEENRRLQATTIAELRHNEAEVGERLQRLAEGMEKLVAIRSDDDRWAEVMGRLLDEVDAERHAGEREVLAGEGVIERLDGLDQALGRITADVSEAMARLPDALDGERRATEREELTTEKVVGRLDGLEQGLDRIAAEVAEVTAVLRSSEDRAQALASAEVQPPPSPGPVDDDGPITPSLTRRPAARPEGRRAAPLRAERRTGASRRRPGAG
ncbi:MAG TPA: hypothetical protein VGR26_07630 [Acidimicrobiales bacterium]|nr:hypothetical protein [Acidimicrobiales bacterium]